MDFFIIGNNLVAVDYIRSVTRMVHRGSTTYYVLCGSPGKMDTNINISKDTFDEIIATCNLRLANISFYDKEPVSIFKRLHEHSK